MRVLSSSERDALAGRMSRQDVSRPPSAGSRPRGPFVTVDLEGGCGLEGCHCSDNPWITVSDGVQMISFTLTREEADTLKSTGRLEVNTGQTWSAGEDAAKAVGER